MIYKEIYNLNMKQNNNFNFFIDRKNIKYNNILEFKYFT